MTVKFAVLLALGIFVSGCVSDSSSSIKARVTSFYGPEFQHAGKTIAFASDQEERDGTLELAAHIEKVKTHFARAGFIPTDNYFAADYIAFVWYGIDDGTPRSSVYSLPEYGVVGGGTTYHSGTVGGTSYSGTSHAWPSYEVTGYSTHTLNWTEYARLIAIDILDGPKMIAKEQEVLYEVKIQSSGSCSSITPVFDGMLEAMFKDFPGENGRSDLVSIPYDGKCLGR